MTETPAQPSGLLTDEEAQALVDSENPEVSAELRARIRERLTDTLRDFSVLYPTLPAADLDAIFNPADDIERAEVRSATQDGLALLVLGMLLGDDDVELRVREAIVNAGHSFDEDIHASLELRRGPLPTLEQFAAEVDDEGLTEHTYPLFEYFLQRPETDSGSIEAIAADLGFNVSAEEIQEVQKSIAPYARAPQTVVTDVAVTTRSDGDNECDS